MASLTSDLASTALRSLGSLALKEDAAVWRFKSDLHKLTNTIRTIMTVLVAHENQPQRHDFENLIERLKDAVHEADDLVDKFTTLPERKKLMKTHGRFIKEHELRSTVTSNKFQITRYFISWSERMEVVSNHRIYSWLQSPSAAAAAVVDDGENSEIGSSVCAKQVCKKQSPMKFAEKVPKIMKNVRVSPRKTINQPR